MTKTIFGNIVDVVSGKVFPGEITVHNGVISNIVENENKYEHYICPGLIDSHIHIESSMLAPSRFAHIAVTHGTVASVSDPHEIANVLGREGVLFMIDDGATVPFKFFFGAPSCVPATKFESTGGSISVGDIEMLLKNRNIKYLSEMMNYPGVVFQDKEILEKISLAKKYNKPVDGHAPGLSGDDLNVYIKAGISTDHECSSLKEAREKLQKGMKILIREGSAAKNFEALHLLITESNDQVMLCSDDLHPDDLLNGHANLLLKKALSKGHSFIDSLRCITLNPIKHYNLEVGLLQKNDPADFIIVDDLEEFNVLKTYINGEKVFDQRSNITLAEIVPPNVFRSSVPDKPLLKISNKNKPVRVIEVIDGELVTNSFEYNFHSTSSFLEPDIENDILKVLVLNRYDEDAVPSVGFIHGFGLKEGAIGSTIAHDSHNIIVVGTNDENMYKCIELLTKSKGGIAAVDDNDEDVMPLRIAGIISDDTPDNVSQDYKKLSRRAKSLGCHLHAPFMTLSFMALLVIPELKMSDRGLFDGKNFTPVDLYVS